MQRIYTVEELMLDDSFFCYCVDKNAPGRAFWEKEIELHSDQKPIFAEARFTIMLLHGKLDDSEVTLQVEKIKKLIDDQEEKNSSMEKLREPVFPHSGIAKQSGSQKSAKHFNKTYLIYGIAALALIFFGARLFQYNSSKVKVIASQPQPIEVSYNSGIGERKSIQLPDGSEAVLNSSSSITFGGDYNQNERSIKLNGEAFFRVEKDPAKPFIVNSGAFSVTAVGTSFYVHARNREKDYKVDLLEGKVRLTSNKNITTGTHPLETILQPGERGAWQPAKMSFTKTLCDSNALRKWISGNLSFRNMAVENVLELLQQWYGVGISVRHKKWAKLTLTGDYDNKPLDHVLKIICFSLSAGYSYSGNQVIIE